MKNLFHDKRPVFLNSIRFPKDLRILVLAPHPDDFDEIGITMRFFRDNGNPIYVAVVSSGAGGVEDSFCYPPTWKTKSEIREEEQRKSCQFFGLPQSHLNFWRLQEDSDGHPGETPENLEHMKQYILGERWNMVFLPHGNDTNLGHRRTYSMFKKIVSEESCQITAFLNLDPKTISMRCDLFTPFGVTEALWKARLLRFHESQHQRNLNTRQQGVDERILGVNRKAARMCVANTMYAEAFELEFLGD